MSETPQVVVIGAASRDLVDDDPRGWRLGGGVSYSALALARLGLPVRALSASTGRPRTPTSSTCCAPPVPRCSSSTSHGARCS